MKNVVFWDIKPSSYLRGDTLIFRYSAHPIILCKICGFHGSDYEECHLLGYKTPVRTSQETHYISATESSQLNLCKI
jgi:hypothetical protein